jgi:hypothetical protein
MGTLSSPTKHERISTVMQSINICPTACNDGILLFQERQTAKETLKPGPLSPNTLNLGL